MFKFDLYLDKPKMTNKKLTSQDLTSQDLTKYVTKIFNKDMNFYVCSSGGCGSTLLYNYLSNFGKVYHIHDRYPPTKLCYIGKENTDDNVYSEWFNNIEIKDNLLSNYKVIFIYRNPIDVIFSRFVQLKGPNIPHLQNIKCINNGNIGLGDIINSKRDFYGLEHFFDNYTIPQLRNYKIYCIKYEEFFKNISFINKVLEIPDVPQLYPVKKERNKKYTYVKELTLIYSRLINKMNNMRFIEIIEPISISNNNTNTNTNDDV
jgi:hypothetical protein